MRTTKNKTDETLSQIIASMGDCTAQALPRILKCETPSADPRTIIAAACGAICAIRLPDQGQACHAALDAIASVGGSIAEAALRQIAAKGHSNALRVEAVARLGRIAREEQSRKLLRDIARDGFGHANIWGDRQVGIKDARVAALLSMKNLPEPNAQDADCIVAAVEAPVATPGDVEIFEAGVHALGTAATVMDVSRVISLLGKAPPDRALSLLSALSKVKPAVLAHHKVELATALLDNISQTPPGDPRLPQLADLAAALSGPQLLAGIASRYAGDTLGNGRGAVWAAALEAAKPSDDEATKAYLAFARYEPNAGRGSRCVKGLLKQAAANRGEQIATAILGRFRESVGYKSLLRQGLLKDVLGSTEAMCSHMCAALAAEGDQRKRDESADAFLCSMLSSAGEHLCGFGDPQWRRNARDTRDRYTERPAPATTLVEALRSCREQDNPILLVARKISSGDESAGLCAIGSAILACADDLADYFLIALIEAASATPLQEPDALPPGSALAAIETAAVQNHGAAMKKFLPAAAITNKKVNRYVIDVMRRKGMGFASAARSAMPVAEGSDARFLLQELGADGSKESFSLIADTCGSTSPETRYEALREIERRATRIRALGDGALVDRLVAAISGRFINDSKKIRLSAYSACEALAYPMLIQPLRTRLKTDIKAVAEIERALASIGEALAGSEPEASDAEGLVTWLRYVGDLGSRALLPRVLLCIEQLHPSESVVLAALECLPGLGGEEALEAVNQYIDNMAPSGRLLLAARKAKAVLENRTDAGFLEALSELFEEGSPVLEMTIDYASMFGPARIENLRLELVKAVKEQHAGHWDDFVTALDSCGEVLNKHLFETHPEALKIDARDAAVKARQDYGHRLQMSAFKNAFPKLAPYMAIMHDLRQQAITAHAENRDGTKKPGVEETEARSALDQFRIMFSNYVVAVAKQAT